MRLLGLILNKNICFKKIGILIEKKIITAAKKKKTFC